MVSDQRHQKSRCSCRGTSSIGSRLIGGSGSATCGLTKIALSCMWVLPYLSFLRSMRAASLGLQTSMRMPQSARAGKSGHRMARSPCSLEVDGVDQFRDALIFCDLVRARAQSLDPVSDGCAYVETGQYTLVPNCMISHSCIRSCKQRASRTPSNSPVFGL